MDSLNKIQNLGATERKIIIFLLLAVIAIPLIILVVKNFQKRVEGFSEGQLVEDLNLSDLKEGSSGIFQDIQEQLTEELKSLEETATSATATDVLATTTQ